jgi:lipoprotein-releasing system permease protein
VKYELRIGWRYLYSGQHDRAMRTAAMVSALVAIAGLVVMLTSHGASPAGVVMLVLGMIAAAVCALLSVFSVFTSVSVLGVVFGVAALTIVLAVTTGFQQQFRDKVLGVNAHVIVMKSQSTFAEYRDVMDTAMHIDPDVIAVQPFIFAEMLVTRGNGKVAGVGIKGVDPVLVKRVLDLESHMEQGSVDSLGAPRQKGDLPPVILGKQLAHNLEASLGSEVTVVVALSNFDPETFRAKASEPRTMRFRVTGIFYSGFDEYDSHLMYTALHDTQELIGRGDQVMGVEMKVKDVARAEAIGKHLWKALGGPPYSVEDWHELNHNLFAALTFQKLALVIILTLIIIVATVNMVSALTMMVADKTREIAILKSMGSTSSSIARVFLVLGLAIGGVGTALGVGIGLATCYSMSAYGYHLDPRVYLIDRLPIDVRGFEVLLVAGITLVISLVATLPPSRSAAALTPVEGLRYD